jgi:hypothetical protein
MKNKSLILFCVGTMMFMSYYCSRKGERQSAIESKITVHTWGNEFLAGPRMDTDAKYLVFLPLIFDDGDGEQGGLLRSWEYSSDYREWTFHLRRDVRWHDGVPVTAHSRGRNGRWKNGRFFTRNICWKTSNPRNFMNGISGRNLQVMARTGMSGMYLKP